MKRNILIAAFLFLVVFIISYAGKCAYSALPTGTGSVNTNLRIFVTAVTHQGNLGGASGADNRCSTDTANPHDGAVFKALIIGGGRDVSTDWVLRANTKYYRLDKTTLIGETGAGKIFSNIPVLVNTVHSSLLNPWTGMWDTWVAAPSTNNCNDWMDSSSIVNGNLGNSFITTSSFIFSAVDQCITPHPLYCVEQ